MSDLLPPNDALPDYPEDDWFALIDYVTGEASPDDRAAMERRLAEDPAFAAFAAPIFAIWSIPRADATWDKAAQWAIIQEKAARRAAQTPPPPPTVAPTIVRPLIQPRIPRPRPSYWSRASTWTALAAGLLVVLLVGRALHLRHSRYYYHATAQDTTVTLPDGSVATLSAGSYLGTETGFPTKDRELYLFGEAHFTVTPNPRLPFIVHAVGVGTRVLGTAFRIHSDTTPNVRVTVDQGKVALEVRDGFGPWHQLDVLTAGQATHVTLVQSWLGQAGYDVASAGVPTVESIRIGAALRRAALQAGAAAVTHPSP